MVGLDAVRIITGHSAKGLEFPYVFVPGMEEELFPHKHSLEESGIEEERRLFYVAMTRARLELTLTRARIRVSRGKEIKRKPSRFLEELPVELIQIDDTPTRREEAMEWIAELKGKLNRNREAGG
ncbi:MAG: ATP-binding domain-containing protein, partial [Planctomycetes bacterium]|nr:ATP-binding domain-containing protein [Planctomycetota bacterium]